MGEGGLQEVVVPLRWVQLPRPTCTLSVLFPLLRPPWPCATVSQVSSTFSSRLVLGEGPARPDSSQQKGLTIANSQDFTLGGTALPERPVSGGKILGAQD